MSETNGLPPELFWNVEAERKVYVPPSAPGTRLHQIAQLEHAPEFSVDQAGELVVDSGVWAVLVACANRFARAGGVTTPEWFAAQSLPEQLALVEAHDRLWAARASAIGTASQSHVDSARVLAPADGGKAALRLELYEAARRGAIEAAGREVSP